MTTIELMTQSAERKAQQCVKWPETLGKSVSVVDANAWGIMHWRSFVFWSLSSLLSVSVIVPWLCSLFRCTHTVWLKFESPIIPWSSSWFMRAVSVASDLFDFSIQFISFLIITLITLLFLLPDTFNFHDVVDKYPAYFRWGPWHPGRERASHTHSPRTWPMHNNDKWFWLGWNCARHSSYGGRISAKPMEPNDLFPRLGGTIPIRPVKSGKFTLWIASSLRWSACWHSRHMIFVSSSALSLLWNIACLNPPTNRWHRWQPFESLLFAETKPLSRDKTNLDQPSIILSTAAARRVGPSLWLTQWRGNVEGIQRNEVDKLRELPLFPIQTQPQVKLWYECLTRLRHLWARLDSGVAQQSPLTCKRVFFLFIAVCSVIQTCARPTKNSRWYARASECSADGRQRSPWSRPRMLTMTEDVQLRQGKGITREE